MSIHVVHVDDTPDESRKIGSIVATAGYQYTWKFDTTEALRLALQLRESGEIEEVIFLVDIYFHGQPRGKTFARTLKDLEFENPIIIITSSAGDARACIQEEICSRAIFKPYTMTDVVNHLTELAAKLPNRTQSAR
jgi:FixJ family two-component response regulator